jgi:hypothetical protein
MNSTEIDKSNWDSLYVQHLSGAIIFAIASAVFGYGIISHHTNEAMGGIYAAISILSGLASIFFMINAATIAIKRLP